MDVVDRSGRDELLGGLNPAQRVPTVVLDDGQPLAESNAILWYFGEGTPFVPDDRLDRARVLQWMFFEQYDQSRHRGRPLPPVVLGPARGLRGAP